MGKEWFKILNKADDAAEVLIYGDIGDWGWGNGIAAADFIAQVRALKAKDLTVRINSNGGLISDGMAIYSYLKARGNVTTAIDSIAASIASLIFLAGDKGKRRIARNGTVFIHEAWNAIAGDSEELRKAADALDMFSNIICEEYADRTGQDVAKLRQMMKDETWMDAQKCVDLGFADVIGDTVPLAASASILRFRNVPAALASLVEKPPASDPKTTTQPTETSMKLLLNALHEAKLIPSATCEDADAANFVKAAIKRFQDEETKLTNRITELEKGAADHKREKAEAYIDAKIAAKVVSNDKGFRESFIKAFVRDEEEAKAFLNGMISSSQSATGQKRSGEPLQASTNTGEEKIDPNLKGRDRLSAAFSNQLKRLGVN